MNLCDGCPPLAADDMEITSKCNVISRNRTFGFDIAEKRNLFGRSTFGQPHFHVDSCPRFTVIHLLLTANSTAAHLVTF